MFDCKLLVSCCNHLIMLLFVDVLQDCLRTMVVAVCERKDYKTLVEYPFNDLQGEVLRCEFC